MRISLCALVAIMATVCNVARADELSTPIDLSSFSGMDSVLEESAKTLDADAAPIVPVDYSSQAASIRPYVTGIVGGSLGTINTGGSIPFFGAQLQNVGSINDTMVNGGGAIGMALDRPSGLLRMEVEGRARGPMNGETVLDVKIGAEQVPLIPLAVNVTNGWSAMTNFWRDYFFNDRFGVYGGGGFGVGGYQYSMQAPAGTPLELRGSSVVNTFAWQVGTGVTYQLSDRITFDTGYRFFAMTPGATPLSGGGEQLFGSYTSAFSASELLISVRIYEPFRNWR
jgi:opacity protein-like surface antigen